MEGKRKGVFIVAKIEINYIWRHLDCQEFDRCSNHCCMHKKRGLNLTKQLMMRLTDIVRKKILSGMLQLRR